MGARAPLARRGWAAVAGSLVLAVGSLGFLAALGWWGASIRERSLEAPADGGRGVLTVDSQADVYPAYRAMGGRGLQVVHLNRRFNMVETIPRELTRTRPFPLALRDPAAVFEGELTADTWLYVATRTGLVRGVVSVLPGSTFRGLLDALRQSPDFSGDGRSFRGRIVEAPRIVTTLERLPALDGPVVVNVDAGYFVDRAVPGAVALALRRAYPDVRALVLVRSLDEPGIDEDMRGRLEALGLEWREGR